ncbi:MAG: HAD family hydrolase [Deltaproteobacteria bacterium]|nr:MAG: HAD family hydrolase [Deltaproteobacteria bacterium]
MNGVAGIIFDCDGVLFESRAANLAYYGAVLETFGLPPVDPADEVRARLCHTAASPEVFRVLLGEERVAAALAVAQDLDYRRFIPAMRPEPEITEVLAALSERFPLAIATNRGGSMREILDHFDMAGYFRAVVTSRDVARPKPHPDMLFEAARRLALAPSRTLFIGDSELDRRAAASAGIPFAAYRNDLPADVRLDSHRQLLGLFGGG